SVADADRAVHDAPIGLAASLPAEQRLAVKERNPAVGQFRIGQRPLGLGDFRRGCLASGRLILSRSCRGGGLTRRRYYSDRDGGRNIGTAPRLATRKQRDTDHGQQGNAA